MISLGIDGLSAYSAYCAGDPQEYRRLRRAILVGLSVEALLRRCSHAREDLEPLPSRRGLESLRA